MFEAVVHNYCYINRQPGYVTASIAKIEKETIKQIPGGKLARFPMQEC